MEDEGPGLGVKEGILGSCLMAGQGVVARHGGGAWDTTSTFPRYLQEFDLYRGQSPQNCTASKKS